MNRLNTISTKELRENFSQVINAMASGQSLTLLYRSQPLAEIKPLPRAQSFARTFSTAQIKRWLREDRLTPTEQKEVNALIDRLP